jgi:hypothetical protein
MRIGSYSKSMKLAITLAGIASLAGSSITGPRLNYRSSGHLSAFGKAENSI